MCKHSYSAKLSRGPRGMKGHCPYPELFEKLVTNIDEQRGEDLAPALLIDDQGICIFHSRDLEWKRENNFVARFFELLDLLVASEDQDWYDFREFVFVGSSPISEPDSEEEVFRVSDRSFPKAAYFTRSFFLVPVELEKVSFLGLFCLREVIFERDLRIRDSIFCGLDFSQGQAKQRVNFSQVQLSSFSIFDSSRFTGQSVAPAVTFSNSRFKGITDFSSAAFSSSGNSTVLFSKVVFEDVVDFAGATFDCHLSFDRVTFHHIADFIDASFGVVNSAGRYRGAAVDFNDIELGPEVVLTFKNTDSSVKMFDHDVRFSFLGDPEGIIRFENVHFTKITPASRERLHRLEKLGRVEIGPGCIKYRHQTEIRSIPATPGNASLVMELCQTFANYFTVSNGINLGFEIVERTSTEVTFFYFTDEDISEEIFLDRLEQTEVNLWNLLSIRSTGELLALEGGGSGLTERAMVQAPPRAVEDTVISAIDGLSSLIGTFFRVGARIALGSWRGADTKALLSAVRFNEVGADERAQQLHGTLVEKYTGRALVGINSLQNEPLPLPAPSFRQQPTVEKVRILFLGANSMSSPLELEREVQKIKTNLKLSRERNNLELRQEWAVTVDSLIQAMLDESPTIVHFSGHGAPSGIQLQDEQGGAKLVGTEALASLFQLFKDKVKCVVLNACYSKSQAEAIRFHIPYVVGMNSTVPDLAALAFSTGFYKAIGAGREIPFAFDLGKVAISMEGVPGENVPVLV